MLWNIPTGTWGKRLLSTQPHSLIRYTFLGFVFYKWRREYPIFFLGEEYIVLPGSEYIQSHNVSWTTTPTWLLCLRSCFNFSWQGLEVIEAHYLFGAEYDDIDIIIHPQSIIHSMIETQDSSILAQLGWPDMRLPILYTLSWPERVYCSEITWPRLDLCK